MRKIQNLRFREKNVIEGSEITRTERNLTAEGHAFEFRRPY